MLLSVRYDGYNLHGWIKQKDDDLTVQGQIELAFYRLTNQWVWSLGASKTDAQVHAYDQRVLVKLDFNVESLTRFQMALNRVLPSNIMVNWIKEVGDNYNVRKVITKEYNYIINDDLSDVFTSRYELHYDRKIDIVLLANIMHVFEGEHDFFYFSGVKSWENINTVRIVQKTNVIRNEANRVVIKVIGPSFIRYQIRMMIGNALRCHDRKLDIKLIEQMLVQHDGLTTNHSAKPYGLFLKKIIADEDNL